MKTLTKRFLLAVMLVVAMVFATVSVMISVNAQAVEPATFQTAMFTMKEGASVRIGSNDAGTEFDYTKNGIRFMAKMSVSDYESIKDDASISYGILIAPKDYHDLAPINKDNVFGAESVYDFTGIEKTRIANIVTDKLSAMDEDKDGSTDYYYYYASMVDLLPANVTRQFVAVSYMAKSSTDLGTGNVTTEYRFCENNLSSRSMSYVAQLALESNQTPEFVLEALQESYIDGKETTVSFEYSKTYDGDATVSGAKVDIDLAIGSTISAEAITEMLVNEGIIDDTFALANASAIEGKKVYADDMTNVSALTFNAKEAESTDYNKLKGYYKTEDGSEIVLKTNKTVEIDGAQAVAYKLYADGTVKTTVAGDTTFGKYDLENGTFNITVDSTVLDYAEVLELDSSVYSAVANTYNYNGTIIKLNKDATLVYDKNGSNEQNGVYLLCYDESVNKNYIVIIADTVITKEITEDAGVYTIDGFAIFESVSKEEYSMFAGYYNCTSAGDYLDKIFKFNTDGTILVNGTDAGTFELIKNGENLTVSATIGGVVMTGTVTKNVTAYGYETTEIELANADSSTVFKLVNGDLWGLNHYDIFASGETYATYYTTDRSVRMFLYNAKTEVSMFDTSSYYKFNIYAGYTVYSSTNSAYRLTQTSAKGGIIDVIYTSGSETKTDTGTYGIDANGKFFVTLKLTKDFGGVTKTFYVEDTSIPTTPAGDATQTVLDKFASKVGTKYQNSHVDGTTTVTLYNTETTLTDDYLAGNTWYQVKYSGPATIATTDYCYRLEPLTEDGMFGKIHFFRHSNYSAASGYYGIINGVPYIDSRSYDPFASAYAGIRVSNKDNYNNVKATAISQVENRNTVYENIGGGVEQVEAFDIYQAIQGVYAYGKNYNGSGLGYTYNLTLNADKTCAVSYIDGTGTYELTEITDNYGIIEIKYAALGGYYFDKDCHIGYYSKVGNDYIIRMMWNPFSVKYWHFIDFKKSGVTFSTYDVFKTMEEKTYTADGVSLELKAFEPVSGNNVDLSGAKFVFTAGETVVNGTYDFVPTSLTAGKIFMDFDNNPNYYNPSDAYRYVIGDYVKVGDNYVISFTYKGVNYVVSDSASSVLTMLAGDYKGANGINLTVDANATINAETVYNGLVTVGETTAKYVIEDNRIIITYKDASYNDVILVKAK